MFDGKITSTSYDIFGENFRCDVQSLGFNDLDVLLSLRASFLFLFFFILSYFSSGNRVLIGYLALSLSLPRPPMVDWGFHSGV